jgi:hypothetical protein
VFVSVFRCHYNDDAGEAKQQVSALPAAAERNGETIVKHVASKPPICSLVALYGSRKIAYGVVISRSSGLALALVEPDEALSQEILLNLPRCGNRKGIDEPDRLRYFVRGERGTAVREQRRLVGGCTRL